MQNVEIIKYNIIISMQEIARNSYVAFIVIYLLSNGITFSEYSYIKVISLVIIVLFEVPFGIIGDKFGQKKVYISSLIFFILTTISIILVKINPLYFALAEIFYGLALASFSGTIGTSKVNEIKKKNPEFIKEYWRQKKINNLLSSSLGSVLGTFLFYFAADYSPFIFAILMFSLTLIISATYNFYEVKNDSSNNEGGHNFKCNNNFIILVAFNACLPLILLPILNSWQLYYSESIFFNKYILIFFVPLLNLVKLLSTFIFKKPLKNSPKLMLILSIIFMGLPWFLILIWKDIFIFCFINFNFWAVIYNIVFFKFLNENIESNNRSTLSSMNSLISRLSGIFVMLIFASLSANLSIIIFLFSSIFLIMSLSLLFIYERL